MVDHVKCPRCGHSIPVSHQGSLFDEPVPLQPVSAKSRRTDPDTSHAAARYPRGDSQRWRILNAHYRWPEGMTDEELSKLMPDMRLNSLTTRRSELAVAGWLYDTGHRRQASGGVDQIVWAMTPSARWSFEKGEGVERRAD